MQVLLLQVNFLFFSLVTPMCKKMKQVSENGLECDESGTFKPLQCEIHDKETKECWCVNDRGDETEGTRAVVKDGSNPDCCMYFRSKF